jgi:hypothetical protein
MSVEYTLSSHYTAVSLNIFPRSEFEEFRGEEKGKGAGNFAWNFE